VSDCERCRELLGGHVLGALEPAEASVVDAHLAGCAACRELERQLAGVPALLDLVPSADTVPERPPSRLEDAILDRHAQERVRPRRRGRLAAGAGRRLAVAAGALGVAATLGVLALTGALGGGTAEGIYVARLTGTDGAPGARARAALVRLPGGTGVRLRASGLPADRASVYQLWCIADDGRWLSAGTFRAGADGRAEVRLTTAARLGQYHRLLVTRAQPGGPAGAGGVRVLSGTIPSTGPRSVSY